MPNFIARKILEAEAISVEKGVAKYNNYFVKTTNYIQFKEAVDEILKENNSKVI